MNKKIFGIALLAASMFVLNGMARTPATPDAPAGKEQAGKMKHGKKGDKHKGGKKDRMGKCDPFSGIELTESQKTELVKLRESKKAERKAAGVEARKERRESDSVFYVKRMEAKKGYLKEVRRILGDDKYVTFLENSYLNGGDHSRKDFRKGDSGRKGKFGKDRKDGRKGGKDSADRRRGNGRGNDRIKTLK